jgi:hypothetical protein
VASDTSKNAAISAMSSPPKNRLSTNHSLPRVHARQFFESGIQREQFFAARSDRLARVVESHVNARATAPLAGLSATGGADQHLTHGASVLATPGKFASFNHASLTSVVGLAVAPGSERLTVEASLLNSS